jgi:hypothetical protein
MYYVVLIFDMALENMAMNQLGPSCKLLAIDRSIAV